VRSLAHILSKLIPERVPIRVSGWVESECVALANDYFVKQIPVGQCHALGIPLSCLYHRLGW